MNQSYHDIYSYNKVTTTQGYKKKHNIINMYYIYICIYMYSYIKYHKTYSSFHLVMRNKAAKLSSFRGPTVEMYHDCTAATRGNKL